MVMPYRAKSTGTPAPAGAPDKINFDRLWEAALRPGIDAAGYEPVRANEDVGALIINEMIERRAISDFAVPGQLAISHWHPKCPERVQLTGPTKFPYGNHVPRYDSHAD